MQALVEKSSNIYHNLCHKKVWKCERPDREIFTSKQDQEKCTRKTENCFL